MRILKSITRKIGKLFGGKKTTPAAPASSSKKSPASTRTPTPREPKLIPFQPHLSAALPTVLGNADYCNFRDQLSYIDQMVVASGLEQQCVESRLEQWLAAKSNRPPSAKEQLKAQLYARLALRCNIARTLLKEDFRGFAARLADSPLLQRFCRIDELGGVRVPSKSTLQRFATFWTEVAIRAGVEQLLRTGVEQPAQLGLEEPLDLESLFLDTTCVPANIHYPVDWVLFRDATRTLMKAVRLIRDQGLKHRMEEPEEFLRRMNRLCIEMTQKQQKARSQRHRRKVLRKMDRLMGTVRAHAQRYRQLLDQQWEQTDWTRKEAEQVLGRIDQVLELLPKARQQARQRILEGQPVENQDKILSLYEADVRVLVRHKAGAEVEFGNTLLLGESVEGLIVDWKLFKDTAPGDSRLVMDSLQRMDRAYGPVVKEVTTDRGFYSRANEQELKERGIYSALCPRQPQELKRRGRSWKFKRLQRRRAQTEGRIAILTNQFLGEPLRSKGFEHRELAVTWGVLAHNLWVLARMRMAAAKEAEKQAA